MLMMITEVKGMGRRGKVSNKLGHYVVRDSGGRFKSWVSIPRSIAVDSRKRTRRKLKKPGYGHLGDYARRRTGKRKR